ncbi:hypothetical protein [Pelagibaculum spongiae]|uniref:Uncharacterized protein n=1 Tax=Pelagibaculum spongiae TaxID=2080658 RepID=A0A2V1GX46_9GAMM|nr:hypothetical protein [Pelagibaculum spongiae]PVZ64353.1 hypothetical protein DC094_20035 [Pelagibaculum spongiae]
MSDDIAFKIQLGLILPKLKDKLAPDLTEIIKELVGIVSAGSLDEDEAFDLAPIKEIIMKDLEIFLDKEILPPIQAELTPPEEESAEEDAAEEAPAAE